MSSNPRVPRAQPEPEKDWEDEYRRLRQQHNELKVLCNEQEEHIRKLQAKTRKLESDFSILRGGGIIKSTPVDKDEESLVATLSAQNSKLKHQHGVIIEKNKQLVDLLEKRKREISSLKRSQLVKGRPNSSVQASRENFPPQEVEIRAAATHFVDRNVGASVMSETKLTPAPVNNTAAAAAAESNLLEIARKYKARLAACEDQIVQLRDDNARLRQEASVTPALTGASNNNNAQVEGQLRDATWRLQQLQTQYDFLASKTASQGNACKDAEEKAEDYAQKVRDLRRALEELRNEKEGTDAKAVRADELEEAVRELRQGNRNLEDKIARLCEVPFINGAFGQQDARAKFEDAAREKEEYKNKMNHLQEAVRTHFSSLTSLKQQAAQYRQEKEDAETKAEELRLKFQELTANSSLMQDKLQLYSGDDGVDMQTLERALTLVKRRGEGLKTRPFSGDDVGEDLVMLPVVKRKLEEVQVMNLKLTEEVEKLETMLKLQSSINKDLHQELESSVYKRDKDKKELIERAEDFEQMAMKRLEKIHSLEAQVRQFVYGVAQKRTKAGLPYATGGPLLQDAVQSLAEGSEFESENALLGELIDERGGDLNPDENLLEVWVKSATIKDGMTGPGSSTFVVVDFFDYESQTTSLISGNKPAWDFATTFKIIVDDFLLRYLATDVITLELNMACQGDFAMLARCGIPLGALLRSKPLIRLTNQPLLSVRTGEIVAHLNVEIRLAIPVSELFRLFLQRHPAEKQIIEDLSTKRVLEAAGDMDKAKAVDAVRVGTAGEDESRLYNELEVAILRASSLPLGADNRPPTAYVHFQFLGHPDKLTNPVPGTKDPNFNERFVFPMVTNDQQLRLLLRSRLQVTVVDMNGEEAEDPSEGLIGEIFLPLKELAEGLPIMDVFPLKSDEGRPAGSLQISMRWKHPFRRPRELGPRSLSATEVENLIAAFSAGAMHEGLVGYRDFCRFVDPPRDVLRTMEKLRTYSQKMYEKESIKSSDLFRVLLDLKSEDETFKEDSFVQRALRAQLDCVPVDFSNLFHFVDLDEDGLISLNQFIAALNLDDMAGLSAVLQDKLRVRVKELNERKVSVLKLFQEADQWGAEAHVSRMEFKGVLKKMGFHLVDEPEPVSVSAVRTDTSRGQLALMDEAYSAADEDDDVLVQSGVGTNAKSGAGFDKDQREIFEKRRIELVALGKREAAIRADRAAAEAKKNAGSKVPVYGSEKGPGAGSEKGPIVALGAGVLKGSNAVVSKNALDVSMEEEEDRFQGQHRSKVSSQGGKSALKILDEGALDSTATKLQSRFRGYSARKSMSPSDAKPTQAKAIVPQTAPAGKPSDILQAEQTIRSSLKALEGVQAPPNMLAGFQTVDTKRTGFVNRMQFAHVMQQMPAIKLYGPDLRACMDFFDAKGDGSHIDYSAFCRLCRYKEPEGLPQVQRLKKIVLGHDSLSVMKGLDPTGSGFIRRADMLRALAELGHNQTPQPALLSMLELFETRVGGQVCYPNFVEYVRECGASSALNTITQKLHSLIMTPNGPPGPQRELNRRWFSEIDREGYGKLNLNQLTEFIRQYEIPATTDAIRALFLTMNRSGSGILLSDFEHWIKDAQVNPYGDSDRDQALFCNPPIGELQNKAHIYMMAVASAPPSAGFTLESVAQSYAVYDWTKPSTGYVSKAAFLKATMRAGFVFTTGEIRLLAGHFAVDDSSGRVGYKKFLCWCTPDGKKNPSGGMATVGGTLGSKRTIAMMMQHLEAALKRGLDLLSVFGRYDPTGVGRITANEFCSALSDLGVTSATEREGLDLADRFKAAAGGFVLYRRIVEELLRLADDTSGAANIDVVDAVRTCLLKNRVDIPRLRDTFGYHDRRGLGQVREEDLQLIFEDAGAALRKPEAEALADRFAVGDRGMVQYPVLLAALEARMGEKTAGQQGGALTIRPPAVSEELFLSLKALFEALVVKGTDFRAELDKFDDSFTGTITQADFRDVMQDRFRAGLSARDLEALDRAFRDPDDPRKISHVRMLRAVHPSAPLPTLDSQEEEEVWDLAEALRQKIRRRCDHLVPGELRRPYRHFARNRKEKDKEKGRAGSGVMLAAVSPSDLAVAVKDLGMKISGEQEARLFDIISLSQGPAFTYTDFVVFVNDPHSQDLVWKLRRSLARSKVPEKEILGALTYQDSNATGYVSIKQFTKAMKTCDVDLSDADVARLTLRFDEEESRRVNISQFMRFVRGQPYGGPSKSDDDESVGADPPRGRNTLEGAESQAWTALKGRAQDLLDTGYTSREVFALFDQEGRGTLDVGMLQQGAREAGALMTRAEARGALRRMTMLCGGAITRETFFEALNIDPDEDGGGDRGRGKKDYDSDGHRGRGRSSRVGSGRGGEGRDRDRDDRDRERGSRSNRGSREVSRDGDRALRSSSRTSGFESVVESLRTQIDRIADEDGEAPADKLDKHSLEREGMLTQKELDRALDRMGVKFPRRDLIALFEGMDRRNSGFVDLKALVETVCPRGGRGESGRDSGRGGKKYENEGSRERDRDRGKDREERIKLKRNEARVVFRKRSDLLQEVLLQMRAVNKERGSTLKDLNAEFKRHDTNSVGTLDKEEFIDCLIRFGFKLRTEVERDLSDSLTDYERERSSSRSRRGVDYADFITAVKAENEADGQADDALESLRERMRKDLRKGAGMQELFRGMDRDGDGEVGVDDFESAMDSVGIPLSREEAKRVVGKFSSNGRSVRYKDFIRSFSPTEVKAGDRDLAAMVLEGMRSSRNPLRDIKAEFSRFDSSGSGKISAVELSRGLKSLQVAISDAEISRLMRRVDKNDSGFLFYKDLVDLLDAGSSEERDERREGRGDERIAMSDRDRRGGDEMSGRGQSRDAERGSRGDDRSGRGGRGADRDERGDSRYDRNLDR